MLIAFCRKASAAQFKMAGRTRLAKELKDAKRSQDEHKDQFLLDLKVKCQYFLEKDYAKF